MTPLVLIGGGGHAKVVLAALLGSGDFHVTGYVNAGAEEPPLLGVPRLGGEEALQRFAGQHPGALAAIGVGMVGSTAARRRIERQVATLGLGLPVVRAATAVVNPDTRIGAGAFLADRVVVNPSAQLGRCTILNTGCIVEHDVTVGDHAHISPGAVVCGGATIGADCWIGAGAVIVQGINVAPGCIVGAGAVVTGDLAEPGTYVGVPARRCSPGCNS